jgi:hypothetical protein
MEEITQDLLKLFNGENVVQQCNSRTTKPHGLSYDLYKEYNLCPYILTDEQKIRAYKRKFSTGYSDEFIIQEYNRIKQNIRDPVDYMELGSVKVNKSERITLYSLIAQKYPGVSKYNNDSPAMRLKWFTQALNTINVDVLYIPYKIGCGLAGGDWNKYKTVIEEYTHNKNVKVYICKI